MINKLKVIKSVKHSGKTFNFTKGLNTITGVNESGKSHLFELMAFALFGSVALRLPAASYDSKTEVELTFTICGTEYTVNRTIKSASLMDGAELIAKTTTVVNKQVAKLLGYGFDVFQIANMASQGSIKQLSNLKPTERKKMIDKTLGLFATKQVIENHKTLLRQLNSNLNAMATFAPVEPEDIPDVNNLTEYKDNLDANIIVMNKLKGDVAVLLERKKQRQKLQQQIDSVVVPVVEGNVPDGITLELLSDLSNQHHNLKNDLSNRNKELTFVTTKFKALDKNSDDLIKSLADAEAKVSSTTVEQLVADIAHYQKAQTKKSLLAQGNIVCENCDHVNHFAAEQLKGLDDSIDVNFPKPELKLTDFENIGTIRNRLAYVATELEQAETTKNLAEAELAQADVNLVSFENKYSELLSNIEQYVANLKAAPLREKALNQLEVLNTQLADFPESVNEKLKAICAKLDSFESENIILNGSIAKIDAYKAYLVAKKSYSLKTMDISMEITSEKKILETLDILLNSIRNEMLPKINAVASTWIQKLSYGLHNSLVLDDDMEIFMDDTALDAFSGSAKDIAHIALRLTLAQILTKGVFPVFLGDEIDAAMDKDRSSATLSAFKDMLNICTDQIILISHADLNLKLDSDNAIQL